MHGGRSYTYSQPGETDADERNLDIVGKALKNGDK